MSDSNSGLGNEDPRGRMTDPRPLDRPFYDRNLTRQQMHADLPVTVTPSGTETDINDLSWSLPTADDYTEIVLKADSGAVVATFAGRQETHKLPTTAGSVFTVDASVAAAPDDAAEQREYNRHRAMFWELFADWFRESDGESDEYDDGGESAFERWYTAYYNGRSAKKHETHWAGYGAADEGFPFEDTKSTMPALAKAPGLNVPPGHGNNEESVTASALDSSHPAFDRTQEAFGAARGCYEVWTDVFADITDAFRGGYQNGDMRWIFKTPINEEFKYVGSLYEELYGLKNAWGWTAVQGTKEFQCDTLGGYEFGRLVDVISFVDYRGAWSDKHPSDPDGNGGRVGEGPAAANRSNPVDHRFGCWSNFGVYDHTYTGPLMSLAGAAATPAKEKPMDDSDPNYGIDEATGKYKVGDHHGVIDVAKIGYGCPGDNNVVATEEHKTNTRIWEESQVGPNVYTTDEASHTGFFSKQKVGECETSSEFIDGKMTTKTGTPIKDLLTVNEYWGRSHDHFFGGKFETSVGGAVTLELAARFDMVVGLVVDIFAGGKAEVCIGPSAEITLLGKAQYTFPKEFDAKAAYTEMSASHTKLSGKVTTTALKVHFLAAAVNL